MQSAGVKTMRVAFDWSYIETSQGNYNFDDYNALADGCAAHNIKLYGVLANGNTIYGDPSDPAYYGTQTFRDTFTNFANATVNHFASRNPGEVATWELWNEPNGCQYHGGASGRDRAPIR